MSKKIKSWRNIMRKNKKNIVMVIVFGVIFCLSVQASQLGEERTKHSWGVGLGLTFNNIPIPLSTFSLPLSEIYYQEKLPEFNLRYVLYGFNGYMPVPGVEVSRTFGRAPVEFTIGAGGFSDILIGGHSGATLRAGVRILGTYELSLFAIPFGTENSVNYSTFEASDVYSTIQFPYYSLMMSQHFYF
jgi:hypothetical protein